MKKILALLMIVLASLGMLACDTPRENATEERVEDAGEAAGKSEDAAEQEGEAVKDGTATMTDTVLAPIGTETTGTTATTATSGTTTTTTTP